VVLPQARFLTTERYFLESFFRERNYCPRIAFSDQKCRSILSNQVISWNGSRADPCPLGREITARTCSVLGNEGTTPDFERLLLEKRQWKHFSTNVLIRGFMNPLHSQLMGEQKCRQVMLLPKFLSRKKLFRKYRSICASKICPATGVINTVKLKKSVNPVWVYLSIDFAGKMSEKRPTNCSIPTS